MHSVLRRALRVRRADNIEHIIFLRHAFEHKKVMHRKKKQKKT